MDKIYVLGFLFSQDLKEVALIRKNRPDWQAGALNGIGGKVELDDADPMEAMVREFKEETGFHFEDWIEFSTMEGTGWKVFCYKGVSNELSSLRTVTDEFVSIIPVEDLKNFLPLPNLIWLIPMALDIGNIKSKIFYS